MSIKGYDWAQNRSKLERAISELKAKGAEITDKSVKEVYRRLLGFVIGDIVKKPSTSDLEKMTPKQLRDLAAKKEKVEDEEEDEEVEKPKKK